MDYKQEIHKLVDTITQEHVLQFFYSLLRAALNDEDKYERALSALRASRTVAK